MYVDVCIYNLHKTKKNQQQIQYKLLLTQNQLQIFAIESESCYCCQVCVQRK